MRRSILALVLLALLPSLVTAQDFTGPAGTYTVTATAPVKITRGPGWITFAWGEAPTPTPDPPKPPTPDPTPKLTGKLYLSLILPATPTQDQTALKSGLLAVPWPGMNADFTAYLEIEPEVTSRRLLGDKKPPVLVIQHSPPGSKPTDPAPVVSVIEAPASVDAVKAAVAKLRGTP